MIARFAKNLSNKGEHEVSPYISFVKRCFIITAQIKVGIFTMGGGKSQKIRDLPAHGRERPGERLFELFRLGQFSPRFVGDGPLHQLAVDLNYRPHRVDVGGAPLQTQVFVLPAADRRRGEEDEG